MSYQVADDDGSHRSHTIRVRGCSLWTDPMDERWNAWGDDAERAGGLDCRPLDRARRTTLTERRDIIRVMTFLRDESACQFVSFIDIRRSTGRRANAASTWSITCCPEAEPAHPVKIEAGEETRVPSIIEVFRAPTGSRRDL